MQRPKMTRVISFRVTDEDWIKIERAAADCREKPPDWCRIVILQSANLPVGLTPDLQILFRQACRTFFLVDNGFALLADDSLESDLWARYRNYAKANLEKISNFALEELAPTIQP